MSALKKRDDLAKVKSPTDKHLWLVLCVSILLQLAAYDPLINPYDEGLILVGAELVLTGNLPYLDFWTMYGPASFYLTAWFMSVFGPADLVVRITGVLAKAAIVCLSYAIVVRYVPRSYALGSSLIILGMLIAVRHDAFPVFPALALALAAIILAARGLRRKPPFLLAAGICSGLVTTFRHDLGAYSAVAIGLAVLFSVLSECKRLGRGAAARKFLVRIGYYAAGVCLVIVPVATLLMTTVPLSDLYESLIYMPSSVYPAVRALPFPGLYDLQQSLSGSGDLAAFAVYVPFLVVPWIFAVLILDARRDEVLATRPTTHGADDALLILLVALTCLLFTLKGLVRVSSIHMIQSIVLAVPLLVIGSTRLSRQLAARVLLLPPLIAGALLATRLAMDGVGFVASGLAGAMRPPDGLLHRCMHPELARLRCVSAEENYLLAARYVIENTGSDDLIYVGTGRHDKVFANAIAIYFMSGRLPVTKWYEVHPGVQTQARVQQQMIAEMVSKPPRLVLLDSRWDGAEEPNQSRFSSGVTLLDDYIRANFTDVARFGTIRVLAPR